MLARRPFATDFQPACRNASASLFCRHAAAAFFFRRCRRYAADIYSADFAGSSIIMPCFRHACCSFFRCFRLRLREAFIVSVRLLSFFAALRQFHAAFPPLMLSFKAARLLLLILCRCRRPPFTMPAFIVVLISAAMLLCALIISRYRARRLSATDAVAAALRSCRYFRLRFFPYACRFDCFFIGAVSVRLRIIFTLSRFSPAAIRLFATIRALMSPISPDFVRVAALFFAFRQRYLGCRSLH